MDRPALEWIPAGTRFELSDMVFYQGKDHQHLDEVLDRIDLVVTGPHATAAFPAEMQPFVDSHLTVRLQSDFCDISTSPVARRWAEIDPRVLYIENPHPRAVRDANRPRPADLLGSLREAFDRLAATPEGRPSLAGVDAVRPVTFGYLPVLRRPSDATEWELLGEALRSAGLLGVDAYERVRDELIDQVIDAKLRRLADLDPTRVSVSDWNSATSLHTLSIHDTMNHTARPDGAVCLERPEADRLPALVALSNRGDHEGEVTPDEDAGRRSDIDVPSLEPALLRSIGASYLQAFEVHDPDAICFNRPYLGGHETQTLGPRLRQVAPQAVVRRAGSPARSLRLGAWQNEFQREFLLGPESTAEMMTPGTGWPGVPPDRVEWIAQRLHAAHDLVRRWWRDVDTSPRS